MRAGMFSARQKVMPRCAKSRHTPARCANTSCAVVFELRAARRGSRSRVDPVLDARARAPSPAAAWPNSSQRLGAQHVGLAVARGHQVAEDLVRHLAHRRLAQRGIERLACAPPLRPCSSRTSGPGGASKRMKRLPLRGVDVAVRPTRRTRWRAARSGSSGVGQCAASMLKQKWAGAGPGTRGPFRRWTGAWRSSPASAAVPSMLGTGSRGVHRPPPRPVVGPAAQPRSTCRTGRAGPRRACRRARARRRARRPAPPACRRRRRAARRA